MTCQHCGAALPPIAMFCGECGRSVSATSVVPRVAERPEAPVSAHGAPPVPTVSPEPAVSPGASVSPEPEPALEPEPEPELEPEPVRIEPEGVRQPAPTPHPSVVVTRWCSECDSIAEPDDLYCAECGHRLADDTRVIEPIAARAVADVSIAPVLQPTVDPEPDPEPEPEPEPEPAALPFGDALRPMPELDLEATRLVGPHEPVPTFVLQFSTGESYTVVGSGLAGRNPRPEPGEVFDHLVTIVDPGRSVSKTHLEFGQTDGVFWVSDRFSGNGTVIRGDAGEHRACAPGRRYPIARGTRIDLGEQFVIVS